MSTKLTDYLDTLVGKPIQVSVLNSKFFPFGMPFKSNEERQHLTLKEHSRGFYAVIMGHLGVYMISTEGVNSYTVEILDDEVSVISWDNIRIVSTENI